MKKYILALIFMASPCLAVDVSNVQGRFEILDDFSGGLNTTISRHKLDKRFSPDMRNVLIDEKPGSLMSRDGSVVAGSTNVLQKVNGIYPFFQESGVTDFLVTDSSIVLTTKDFQFYTFISSGLNTGVVLRCKQIRNSMWCGNGVDPWFSWNGTTKKILDGTNNTANVPKFKFIEYDQERVWGLNKPSNGSALDFSAVASTDGIAISPEDSRAWPATNSLNVGQGNGQVGTALWVKDGKLYIGKERSIYIRYGTNTSNYNTQKTNSQVGPVSQDSVRVLDGHIYFLGNDGIYEDDRRISDAITNDVSEFVRQSANTIENSWETKADFDRGKYLYGTTVTAFGFVTTFTTPIALVDKLDLSNGGPVIKLNGTSTFTAFVPIVVSSFPSNFLGYVGNQSLSLQISILLRRVDSGACNQDNYPSGTSGVTFYNKRNEGRIRFNVGNTFSPTFAENFAVTGGLNPTEFYTGDDINNSSITIKVEITSNTSPGLIDDCYFEIKPATVSAKMFLVPSSTGQYISDITTMNSVSAWGNLDSVNATNAGRIDFFVRTSTSLVNIATRTWSAITPGVRINAPTNENFVQFASTVNSVSSDTLRANIDNVKITHIEGSGSNDRAFAADWKNRYWLSVATETSGRFSNQYVKAKITNPVPDAWMLFSGLNIRAFSRDNDTFYGGAASTGVFYRLDYGTNDNGYPISAYWTSADLSLDAGGIEAHFSDKRLIDYMLDCDKQPGATLKLGTSINGGTYVEKLLSIDGNNEMVRSVSSVNANGNTFSFRFKVDDLDKRLIFHGFALSYNPFDRRTAR